MGKKGSCSNQGRSETWASFRKRSGTWDGLLDWKKRPPPQVAMSCMKAMFGCEPCTSTPTVEVVTCFARKPSMRARTEVWAW